jgi:hypothetical protein
LSISHLIQNFVFLAGSDAAYFAWVGNLLILLVAEFHFLARRLLRVGGNTEA